jgi:hypothetical protein
VIFELEVLGGPLGRRLARRRADVADLAWEELRAEAARPAAAAARLVWTQSAFSEYASAAAFAEIAGGLFAVGAPIDLSAAAGDFVVDEVLHAELSARVAMALGGAVALDVDLSRLVRPPASDVPFLAVAERIVRTSCVGESLTVALLLASKKVASSAIVGEVLARIARDEAEHAELGWAFLDWAEPRLADADRDHLARAASGAIASFAPLVTTACDGAGDGALGVMTCAAFDPVFADALARRVLAPLAARGIEARGAPPP